MASARQQDYAIEVFDFAAFDFVIFAVDIRVGQKLADGASTGAAVRHVNHGLWIKAMLHGPAMPHPLDRGSGIDEHTIQVK